MFVELSRYHTQYTSVLIHSVQGTQQTPDPQIYYIITKNQKNIILDTKYNFILYLILHYMVF